MDRERGKECSTHSITNSKIIFVLNNSKQLDCIVASFFYMQKDLYRKSSSKLKKLNVVPLY